VEKEARRFNFIIRHSAKDIERHMPRIIWKEHDYANAEQREAKFIREIRRKRKKGLKVLVAGMSDTDRERISSLLKNQEQPVQHVDFHERLKDPAATVASFARQEDLQVALLSDRVMYGVDGLKKAQTVLFWSDQHQDYTDSSRQTTCIKRICRLGSEHTSGVSVEYFSKAEEEDVPEAKRRRLAEGGLPAPTEG